MNEIPVLGVIGGSGLYQISGLTEVQTLDVDTPFGKPSAPIVVGTLENKRVAFLSRHGIGHHISPSEVNYRANIYALKALGIGRILSISACGSLRDDFAPGHFVIPDQLVDYTRMRECSFFKDGLVAHIGAAEPFCPQLSEQILTATNEVGGTTHRGGTLITIEGPRFSTRAESNLFRAWGLSLIGMTACPEAFLAREAEMCYATMAHVTDYDVWHTSEEPVSVDMVIRTLNQNTVLAQEAVKALVRQIKPERPCTCGSALSSALITSKEAIPAETRQKLDLLVKKYL